MGNDGTQYSALELSCDLVGYIDFTSPNVDSKGSFQFNMGTPKFSWYMTTSERMILTTSGLTVQGSVTPTSDKRLKFNEKPLVNALGVINRLEPVEYDQTHNLVDEYTVETPQSHQCGFIAQSVQQIDELRYTVVGGKVGEDGKESRRGLNYHLVLTYAVHAIQELSQNSKCATGATGRATTIPQHHLSINSATII